METSDKIIDIGKALKKSNSAFLKSLPGFVIKWMENLIHQEEMNATIYRRRYEEGLPFIKDVLEDWNVNIDVKGIENIPLNGRYVFAANHPLGGIDALSFLSTVGSRFPDLVSPSNEILNTIPNLRPLMLGLNVFGRNSRKTAIELDKLFISDKQVVIFPAGEVSRRAGGVISDIPWQKSFVAKAVQFKRDIVPVFITGRNSDLFYNVARIRKLLGIKMYVETILLPREMMNQRNSSLAVIFGNIIPYKTFTDKKSNHEWAQHVKEIVYKIPSQQLNKN